MLIKNINFSLIAKKIPAGDVGYADIICGGLAIEAVGLAIMQQRPGRMSGERKLLEALRPFAKLAAEWDDEPEDCRTDGDGPIYAAFSDWPTINDTRRARAALAQEPKP